MCVAVVACYKSSYPHGALHGRQTACPSDLQTLGHERQAGTSDHSRGQRMRESRLEVIESLRSFRRPMRSHVCRLSEGLVSMRRFG
eukprot:8410283-Pyramimonas_sp.AAC.1